MNTYQEEKKEREEYKASIRAARELVKRLKANQRKIEKNLKRIHEQQEAIDQMKADFEASSAAFKVWEEQEQARIDYRNGAY